MNATPRPPDPCALARPLRARSLALHRSASSCISRTARSSRTPLASPRTQHVPFQLCRTFTHSDAEFSLCQRAISSTLAHISAIPSGRWINQRTECPRFARTSARRSRQRKMDEQEAREDVEEEAAIPSSSRRMLPCLCVCLPPRTVAQLCRVVRIACTLAMAVLSSQSCIGVCPHVQKMPCRMCVSVSRVGSFSILPGCIYVL